MKVGSFRQTQEPNRNAIHRKGGESCLSLLRPEWIATALTGKLVPWQGRVLTAVDVLNLEMPEQNSEYSSELSGWDREVLDSVNSVGRLFEVIGVPIPALARNGAWQ